MTFPRPVPRTDLRRRLAALVAVLVGALGMALWSTGSASAHAELLWSLAASAQFVRRTYTGTEGRYEPVSLAEFSAQDLFNALILAWAQRGGSLSEVGAESGRAQRHTQSPRSTPWFNSNCGIQANDVGAAGPLQMTECGRSSEP